MKVGVVQYKGNLVGCGPVSGDPSGCGSVEWGSKWVWSGRVGIQVGVV